MNKIEWEKFEKYAKNTNYYMKWHTGCRKAAGCPWAELRGAIRNLWFRKGLSTWTVVKGIFRPDHHVWPCRIWTDDIDGRHFLQSGQQQVRELLVAWEPAEWEILIQATESFHVFLLRRQEIRDILKRTLSGYSVSEDVAGIRGDSRECYEICGGESIDRMPFGLETLRYIKMLGLF